MTSGTRWAGLALILSAATVFVGCAPAKTTAPSESGPHGSPTAGSSTPGPIRLLIDTDLGADDIVAIASLLRSPGVDVVGITVAGTGEVHCASGVPRVMALVALLTEASIPVACGRESPLGPAQGFPDEWRAGADAGYGLKLAAPAPSANPVAADALILQLATESDRPLTILTIGPLTNLAVAAAADAALPSRIDRVVAMVGAVDVPGNVAPPEGDTRPAIAEWNAHADPIALAQVLDAGFDVTFVPLDATNSVPLTRELIDDLGTDHDAAPADLVFELWSRNPFLVDTGTYLWDALAAMSVVHPEVLTTRPATIRVIEGEGLDGGQTVEDPAGRSLVIATAADEPAFREQLFAALRLGGPRSDAFVPVTTITVDATPGQCATSLAPEPASAGLLALKASAEGAGEGLAAVFGLGDLAWPDVVAFAAAPDFEHPPPLVEIASIYLGPDVRSGTAYADADPGMIGIACLSGDFEASPTILLAGPYELRP
jgi:inosine-uridine nucleoside N-ribohydrolase